MQDRCLGMYYHTPNIDFISIDRNGNRKTNKFLHDESLRVIQHLKAPVETWSADRIIPYLYKAANEPENKADGKCGKVTYYPIEIEK